MELLLGPTGVLHWDEKKAYNGYTVVAPSFSNTTYLLDMEGDIVHKWEHSTKPGLYAELLPNGNLLRGRNPGPGTMNFGGTAGGVEEFDWEGNLVWSYVLRTETETQHHTFKRLPNGNTFILGWEIKSREECIAKGRKPETLPEEGYTYEGINVKGLAPDYLLEVDPSGKTVWEWHVWDHIGTGPEQFDINFVLPQTMGYLGYADWTHFNTIDYDPVKDVILLNSRNFGEFYLIDHKTGKMLYRWGNPCAYGKGKAPAFCEDNDQVLFGPHNPSLLENGNVLIFDNGWMRPELNRSRVLEMNPKTNEIVWEYISQNPNGFSTPFQGAAQRLANGNTLITSSNAGQVFEVTPEKEIAWVFVSPWAWNGVAKRVLHDVRDTMPKGQGWNKGGMLNMVHRAYRYDASHPAFKGKDLSKKERCVDTPHWFKQYAEMQAKDVADAEKAEVAKG